MFLLYSLLVDDLCSDCCLVFPTEFGLLRFIIDSLIVDPPLTLVGYFLYLVVKLGKLLERRWNLELSNA